MIDQTNPPKKRRQKEPRTSSDRTAAGPHETKWSTRTKKEDSSCYVPIPIQTMKTMRNGVITLIKKGAAEFHKRLPRCKDHPALLDDAAVAVLLTLPLLSLLMELAELVVVVPVGDWTVGVSTEVGVSVDVGVVDVGVITELETERDVTDDVVPEMEPEDPDDNEVSEPRVEIRVMAKEGLVSPESPYKTMR